jgi:hypothetical protein
MFVLISFDCIKIWLFQPQYSYVDGDGTVPAESAKVLLLTFRLISIMYLKFFTRMVIWWSWGWNSAVNCQNIIATEVLCWSVTKDEIVGGPE